MTGQRSRLARLEVKTRPLADLHLIITRLIVGLSEAGELVTLATVRREVTVRRGEA